MGIGPGPSGDRVLKLRTEFFLPSLVLDPGPVPTAQLTRSVDVGQNENGSPITIDGCRTSVESGHFHSLFCGDSIPGGLMLQCET